MQRTGANYATTGKGDKRKAVINSDLDELFNQSSNNKGAGKGNGLSIYQERLMRSK